MKPHFSTLLLVIILTGIGCTKLTELSTEGQPLPVQQVPDYFIAIPDDMTILVDASKDGGTWWFPQSPATGFSNTANHQGKGLADYLHSLGFRVDELPRGAVVTKDLLDKYSKIIRSPAFFPYTDDELTAYKSFLNRRGAILLLQDHLSYTGNDKLSIYLGLKFEGAVDGTITNFTPHEITGGISSIPFIGGAVVTNTENNPKIVVLGSLNKNSYQVLNNSSFYVGNIAPPVMGTVNNFPDTRIFFLGDVNALELLPQPFTKNLVHWLFQ